MTDTTLVAEPVRAYRRARTGGTLGALTRKVAIPTGWTEASCHGVRKDVHHPAPDPDCSCGWWSASDHDTLYTALAANHGIGAATLTVELKGRVVVHDGPDGDGQVYRAQHQRVVRVEIDAVCAFPTCGRPPTGIPVADPDPTVQQWSWPTCRQHQPATHHADVEQLSARWGVPVVWAETSPWSALSVHERLIGQLRRVG